MALRTLILTLLIVAAANAHGDASAVIEGPEEAQAGDLIVLNSDSSKGDAFRWIIPEKLKGKWIKTERQLAFATRDGGDYIFHLVAVDAISDSEVDIDTATHTVVVDGDICDPDDPPDDDPPDDDPPDDDPPDDDPGDDDPHLAQVREISRQRAADLGDPKTAAAIADAIAGVPVSNVKKMRESSTQRVEDVLLARKGESRTKDWLEQWRRPVNEVTKGKTPEVLKKELDAIVAGLRDSLKTDNGPIEPPPTAVKVIFYTRDNCGYCQDWKRDVMPSLMGWGWAVEERMTSGMSVPQFDVVKGNKTERLRGFQSEVMFRKFL